MKITEEMWENNKNVEIVINWSVVDDSNWTNLLITKDGLYFGDSVVDCFMQMFDWIFLLENCQGFHFHVNSHLINFPMVWLLFSVIACISLYFCNFYIFFFRLFREFFSLLLGFKKFSLPLRERDCVSFELFVVLVLI